MDPTVLTDVAAGVLLDLEENLSRHTDGDYDYTCPDDYDSATPTEFLGYLDEYLEEAGKGIEQDDAAHYESKMLSIARVAVDAVISLRLRRAIDNLSREAVDAEVEAAFTVHTDFGDSLAA